jgi:hypothetical protein
VCTDGFVEELIDRGLTLEFFQPLHLHTPSLCVEGALRGDGHREKGHTAAPPWPGGESCSAPRRGHKTRTQEPKPLQQPLQKEESARDEDARIRRSPCPGRNPGSGRSRVGRSRVGTVSSAGSSGRPCPARRR